jgi:hypothetical protein
VVGYYSSVHFVDHYFQVLLGQFHLSQHIPRTEHRPALAFLFTFVSQSEAVGSVFLVRINRSWSESENFGSPTGPVKPIGASAGSRHLLLVFVVVEGKKVETEVSK